MIIKNNKVEGNYCQYIKHRTESCASHVIVAVTYQIKVKYHGTASWKQMKEKKKKPWPISIMSYMEKPNHVGDGPQLQKATKQS